ncbi:MAG: hypothetical protein JOZ90_06530 [Alphaproteobacteria bacterium]|nr:hypothetical protein [Alphaproteobacteria bacterium]MBV9370063.1 hypothetical protein [Alphaproteobacteria bacterium]MBV9900737.1 hypothetical protein [Alphaproteobacteria bacterium]
MKMKRGLTVVSMVVLASLAAATPARAAGSICDIDPNTSFYSWFAHTFGYCNGA